MEQISERPFKWALGRVLNAQSRSLPRFSNQRRIGDLRKSVRSTRFKQKHADRRVLGEAPGNDRELQAMVDGALAFFRSDADEEAVTNFDLPRVLQTIANDYADQDIEIAYAGLCVPKT